MAKKRKKIKIALNRIRGVAQLPISDDTNLPAYSRFVDTPLNKQRYFFEPPLDKSEIVDQDNPDKKFYRLGMEFYSRPCFHIVTNGVPLVGEDIAKTFASTLIKKYANKELSNSFFNNATSAIKLFFTYLSKLENPPILFTDLIQTHFSGWVNSFSDTTTAKRHKDTLQALVKMHPHGESLNLERLWISHSLHGDNKVLEHQDFDRLVGENDYSDQVMFQVLAFLCFDLEKIEERFNRIKYMTLEDLGSDYYPYSAISSENKKFLSIFTRGEKCHEILLDNMFLTHQDRNPKDIKLRAEHASKYLQKLYQVTATKTFKQTFPTDPMPEFLTYLVNGMWSRPKSTGLLRKYVPFYGLASHHHQTTIVIYTLISAGINKEVVFSLRRIINGKPWYENFDVELGITEDSATRDKQIVIYGEKHKGKGAYKSIPITLTVNSPLYRYIKMFDETRDPDRKYIFNSKDTNNELNQFCEAYPIYDDDGERLMSLSPNKFRKTFAGHKLLKLLGNVGSADELVVKLKESLNHSSFDTTLFSYIMKSGVGNTALNTAIVSLTSDLLEKALAFKGTIREDHEKNAGNKRVFLCECNDPTNPTHGLPIAGQCNRFDMCLGCERSEVYSNNLPSICFRLLQYEEKRIENPEAFGATLEDRRQIAMDTIATFRLKHPNGEVVVEESYQVATQAMADNKPMMPPIIQSGAL
jgi:hypothetical protein